MEIARKRKYIERFKVLEKGMGNKEKAFKNEKRIFIFSSYPEMKMTGKKEA
jgi:hypothetical protein